MPGGRPTKYNKEYHCKHGYNYALLGSTDKQIAKFLDISEATLNNWKIEHPEFLESLKEGKEIADANVSKALYHRALGYQHPEEKIFIDKEKVIRVETTKHYAPDTAAGFIWLKNRQPEIWRDKQEIDHTTKGEKINLPPWMIDRGNSDEQQ